MTPTFEAFSAEQCAIGCDEVIERSWKPGTVIETHTHPFSVRALVVNELELGVPHSERYGAAEGATYWVARTNGRVTRTNKK